uniref:G-protein coupled receptors family 1 profile domain-containing protein n=1 Tax=Strongyloides stercoralis TaxID=6248 RepID=A0A0K0DZ00_STRER
MTLLRYILFSIELLILTISLPLLISFMYIMSKTETMNERLKILLVTFGYSGILNVLTRYISIAWYLANSTWFPENGIIYHIVFKMHNLCVVMLIINPVVIAIERTFASIFLKSYEEFKSILCNFFLRVVSWILSLLFMGGFYMAQSEIATIFYFVITILINTATLIIFSTLFFINKRKFSNVGNVIKNSLSYKYQITENIRTLKMLSIFIAEVLIIQVILQSMLSVIYFYLIPNKMFYEYQIFSNVFDIINAFFLTTFFLPILLAHKETKKLFFNILKIRKTKINAVTPKNILGNDLIIYNTNHDNIKMLQEIWR